MKEITYTVIEIIKSIAKWLERCRIRVYAAQASFFITISAFPFLILLLSVIGIFLPQGDGAFRDTIISHVPTAYSEALRDLLDEIQVKSNVSIMSVSAFTLLWSASKGVRSIGEGVRVVISDEKSCGFLFSLFKSFVFTLLYIVSVVTALILWVFGDAIFSAMERNGVYFFSKLLNGVAFFIVLTAIFSLTYVGYAGKKLSFFPCVSGAAFSAAGWFVFSRFFEFYLDTFADYSYVYGSIATVIVVMLWFYACAEILLIGAGICSKIGTDRPNILRLEIRRKG